MKTIKLPGPLTRLSIVNTEARLYALAAWVAATPPVELAKYVVYSPAMQPLQLDTNADTGHPDNPRVVPIWQATRYAKRTARAVAHAICSDDVHGKPVLLKDAFEYEQEQLRRKLRALRKPYTDQ